jgi:hypothetical protein
VPSQLQTHLSVIIIIIIIIISIATGYGLHSPVPVQQKFPFLILQISSRAHPASYTIGMRGVKRLE